MIHAVNRPLDSHSRQFKDQNLKQKPTDSIAAKRNAIKKITATPPAKKIKKFISFLRVSLKDFM